MTNDLFLELLHPVVQALKTLDLTEGKRAAAELTTRFPLNQDPIVGIRAAMEEGIKAGWLVPKQNGEIRFGRLAKDLQGYSIDAVLMSTPGPRHRHKNGEIDLCFARSGDPRFDRHPQGWVVYPPESIHTPTVTGGEMAILYFLPGGVIEFLS